MKTYTKAVFATLAGALAVGMVPAMALADDDAVELLDSASIADDMDAASIAEFAGDLPNGYKFTYNGNAQALVPETVLGSVSGLTYEVSACKYYLIGDESNTASFAWIKKDTFLKFEKEVAAPTAVGKYAVVAYVADGADGTADDAPVRYVGTFEIVGQGLTGAQVVEIDDADLVDGIADAGIVYDGTAKEFTDSDNELDILVDGKPLASYTVDAYYTEGNVKIDSAPTAAGNYKVAITATDAAHNGQKIELPYTIQKYDLAKATLDDAIWTTGTQPTATNVVTGVTGLDNTPDTGDLVVSHSATPTNGHKVMTVTLKATAAEKDSVTGTATLEYDVVSAEKTPTIEYNGAAPQPMIVGAANPKVNFSAASVGAKVDNTELKDGEFELVVKRVVNGTELPGTVDPSVLVDESIAGVYNVYVKVVPSAAGINYAYAGISTDYIQVTVNNGEVQPANAAFVYGGQALKTSAMTLAYTGADFADAIGTSVKTNAGATLVEGTDYTVEIKKDGKVVTEAVDAGIYTFTIKSTKYTIAQDVSFTLTVSPAAATPVLLDQLTAATGYQNYEVLYTGKAIDPIVKFTTVNAAGKTVDIDVPADAYKVTINSFKAEKAADQPTKTPTEVKAAGTYNITISDAKVDKDNYAVQGVTYDLIVTSKNVFLDVPSGKWFADEVYAVAAAGIMTGYGNGVFGPYDNMIRGDFALTMYRMAGNKAAENGTAAGEDDKVFLTPFDDVSGKEYYAKAIQWANNLKIMTGYDNGLFGDADTITREQAAVTLYRYEAALGNVSDGAIFLADAIDAYADADEVSAYAVEAMNWAVEKGLMGVDTDVLNPGDEITRAEIAAILVRYMAL